MKFSPKCNTKSDIGKFVVKFGNFCLYLGKKKQGPITLGKSLPIALRKAKIVCNFDLSECNRANGVYTVYQTKQADGH